MDSKLPAYEKLGAFYLGRPKDPRQDAPAETPLPLLYDSRDLLTHAVCVGMTGSGKTGLCIGLLEEAAIDGVPSLIIDPKGDLTNLKLTFPRLAPEDFAPWVDPGEAQRGGISVDQLAAQKAELWRDGLAKWDQGPERIERFRQAAEVKIYTPGSSAGEPVSILGSLAAPGADIRDQPDLLGDRVQTVAASLLGLLGIDADPVKSREQILLSTILTDRWRRGVDLDLAGLIQLIQQPPVERVGVMDLDTFYPADDRFELALALNNLLAAPGMESWLTGTPLDLQRILYTDSGKPRLAVMSIAHLSDSERMFFVSLLLNEAIGWMRGRSGTTSLRALLYMDEVFGYLPPVAEPPSKKPLLTLLKQARAFGFGVVLSTQNPADLDYKALSNAGTWFLGRLQTERDKLRVLDGLEGAAAGAALDRKQLERTLSSLGKRVFLLHNVHEREPVLFETRWVLSYLAGPLTRSQIERLCADQETTGADREPGADQETGAGGAGDGTGAERGAAEPDRPAPEAARPVLPPQVPQLFVAATGSGDGLTYRPALLASCDITYSDGRRKLEHSEELTLLLPLAAMSGAGAVGTGGAIDWRDAEELAAGRLDPARDLLGEPEEAAAWGKLPQAAADPKSYKGWQDDLEDSLYRNRRLELFKSESYGEYSQPGESERDFRVRLGDAAREARDDEKAKLEDRFAGKLQRARERIRKAEQRLDREQEQASSSRLSSWAGVASTAASFFLGRKKLSVTNLRRASSAVKGFGRTRKESGDVERAEDEVEVRKAELVELEAELEAAIDELEERFDPAAEELEEIAIRPKKSDIVVRRFTLAWLPTRPAAGDTAAWG